MSQNRQLVRVLITICMLFLIGCSTVGPLCRSDERIRASILRQTPIGCTSDQVRAFIKQHGWPIDYESRDRGFMKRRPGCNETHSVEVGSSAIRCVLGDTRFVFFPFVTTKLAYWGFDQSGRLIDVWVDQETDAL